MDLNKKVKHAFFWTTASAFLIKVFGLAFQLWMTKELGKSPFSDFAIISVFLFIGSSLVDSGFLYSLLRKKKITDYDTNSIFYGNIFFSVVVYLIIYFSSTYIAGYLEQPTLVFYIRFYCITFFFTAFTLVHSGLMQRDLKFKQIAIIEVTAFICSVLVGVFFVKKNMGIWSLISVTMTLQFVSMILYWFFSKWRPKLLFSKEVFKEHFYYGYKLSINSFLVQGFDGVYDLLLGKLNYNQLSYYNRSKIFVQQPIMSINGVIKKATFPILAKIKDDPEIVIKTYVSILKGVFFITLFILTYLFVCAPIIIEIVLGEKWLNITIFVRILCLSFLVYPLINLNLNVMILYGRSDLILKFETIKKVIMIFILLIVYKFYFSVYALLITLVFFSIINYAVNTIYSSKFIAFGLRKQLLVFIPYLVVFIFLGIILYYGQLFFLTGSNFSFLFTSFISYTFLSVFMMKLFKNKDYNQFKSFFLKK